LAILTALVIATIIIAAGYVGYHAWQESLHEKPEKHSQPIESHSIQTEFLQSVFQNKIDPNTLIS
jgi:predicted negative regulator of RcsB-dependent stress response